MSEKRFIVESVMKTKDCNEDKSRIVKVITDKEELYSYDDLYEISELLNELAEENEEYAKIIEQSKRYEDGLWVRFTKLEKENEMLKKDNQRQKTLRNKHWREIQARANAYNRIISSLEDIIPQPMIEELRNAPLLDCDYDGVESNE